MKITIEIPAQKIADLMVTAVEGNYMVRAWCNGIFLISPKSYEKSVVIGDTRPWYSKAEVYEKSFELSVEEIIDESKHIAPDNIKKYKIGSVNFAEGFKLMAVNSPKAFADFMNDNYDIFTADIFLQYVVFGEVIYG